MKNKDGNTSKKGRNPFDGWYVEKYGKKVFFSSIFKTYDWVNDNGYNNMGKWIEQAAKDAGK